eukprot:scaffold151155_cov19-Prasinocladus_malaysianus.AAC.1
MRLPAEEINDDSLLHRVCLRLIQSRPIEAADSLTTFQHVDLACWGHSQGCNNRQPFYLMRFLLSVNGSIACTFFYVAANKNEAGATFT